MTEPLRPGDPSRLGAYRLLSRLGEGGMGVVYLGRSDAGTPAAVKMVLAEHARDPAFRERFRREAAAAARVPGPWVAPVLAADTEAARPWLATAFVPGPSLAEQIVVLAVELPAAIERPDRRHPLLDRPPPLQRRTRSGPLAAGRSRPPGRRC
jgi:eukaryotic-like serine/threonine-protein kinase